MIIIKTAMMPIGFPIILHNFFNYIILAHEYQPVVIIHGIVYASPASILGENAESSNLRWRGGGRNGTWQPGTGNPLLFFDDTGNAA